MTNNLMQGKYNKLHFYLIFVFLMYVSNVFVCPKEMRESCGETDVVSLSNSKHLNSSRF